MPALILSFLQATLDAITAGLPEAAGRIAGIGVAMPGQIWSWAETIGAPPSELDAWRDTDFPAAIARFSDLPVFIDNDATAACRAENTYGKGREFRDFAYFFLGSFIGGGVVMNHTVYEGYHNNAGAFGSLPSMDGAGGLRQLIDTASIYLLEARLREAGTDPAILWNRPDDWSSLGAPLERWIETTAAHLAQAALTACAVIDFEAVLIDGGFPADVRRKLVEATRANLLQLDMRGLFAPRIEEGAIGRSARSIGAASAPVFARYFLNTLGGVSGNLG